MECICHRQHSWPMSAVPDHAANARSSEELQALGHGQRPEAVEVTHRSLRVTPAAEHQRPDASLDVPRGVDHPSSDDSNEQAGVRCHCFRDDVRRPSTQEPGG